ncbi:MAG: hypothetical protein ACYCZR_03465 [Burkholderiales bacterium]
MSPQDILIQAEALSAMMVSPGWQLFAEHLRKLTEHEFALMKSAKNNEELAKHTNAYILLLELKNSPASTVAVLTQQLQNTKKA